VDVLTPAQRSFNMSRIRGQDTKPELAIRRGLHMRGLRFRLHVTALPGRPDLIFPKYGAAVFIHGCFWHGHDCARFKLPATRRAFWSSKIAGNRERDRQAILALQAEGWRVLTVWECSLRGPGRQTLETVISRSYNFIVGRRKLSQLFGAAAPATPKPRPATAWRHRVGACRTE
jgi:DNA mismatch endonuclease (patch repair protein)